MTERETLIWCKMELLRQMRIRPTPPIEARQINGINCLSVPPDAVAPIVSGRTGGEIQDAAVTAHAGSYVVGFRNWNEGELIDGALAPIDSVDEGAHYAAAIEGWNTEYAPFIAGLPPYRQGDETPFAPGLRAILHRSLIGITADVTNPILDTYHFWLGDQRKRNHSRLLTADYAVATETTTLVMS